MVDRISCLIQPRELRAQKVLFKQLIQSRNKMDEIENEIIRLQNQLQNFDTI